MEHLQLEDSLPVIGEDTYITDSAKVNADVLDQKEVDRVQGFVCAAGQEEYEGVEKDRLISTHT